MVNIINIPDGNTNWGEALRANLLSLNEGISAAYTKPGSGIPEADLSSEVATKLNFIGGIKNDSGMVVGKDGKTYRVVAGVIRNDGAPNYWQPIIDSDHQGDLNVSAVATTGSWIEITHPIDAIKVVSFHASPDDTLARQGFTVGTSVGLLKSRIIMGRSTPDYTDYVYYNGTSWVSTTNSGVSLAFSSAGVLTMTHPEIDAGKLYKLSATTRDGKYVAQLAGSGMATTTSMAIVFRNMTTGALATVADTDMRVLVSHGGGLVNDSIIHRDVDVLKFPGSNIWFYGVFEVAPGPLS